MAARSGCAVPLDRSEMRFSLSGNPNHAVSQLLVISEKNVVRRTRRGNSETKQSRTTVNTASFLIGSVLFMNGQLEWEQQ
jgi:hypothetical protein